MNIEQITNDIQDISLEATTPIAASGLDITERMLLLIFQIAIIIFAVRIGGGLMRRLKMPSVLGELLAGMLIGPYILGGVSLPSLGFDHGLFPIGYGSLPVSPELYGVATIASLILLFVAGLETDIRQFLRYSIAGTIVGLGGVIGSFALGDLVGMIWSESTITSFMTPSNLFLGILCTATSVGITARILSEKRKMDTPEGVTILAAAVVDDVLGIICLAIVIGLVDILKAGPGVEMPWGNIAWIAVKSFSIWIGFTALGIIFSNKIGRFLKYFSNPMLFAMLALGMAFLLAAIFEQLGLAMIIGAYVMGLSLSKTDITFAVQERLHSLYDFFVPIFFAVMGMLVDVQRILEPSVIKLGLIYAFMAIVAKVVGCSLPALFLNFNFKGAIRVGAGMVPRGEVALIIAGIGVTTGILNSDIFGAAIIMTLITTLVAPPLLSLALNIPGKGVTTEVFKDDTIEKVYKFPSREIRDAATDKILAVLGEEGFYYARMDASSGLYQIRKDDISFSMHREGETLVFSSDRNTLSLIRAVVYEAIVELHTSLAKLHELIRPEEMKSSILSESVIIAPPLKDKVNILQSDSIILNLSATDKQDAIKELVDLLHKQGKINRTDDVLQAVVERENIVSTGLENGIAMPHARSEFVNNVVAAVGISRSGIDFVSFDGKPAHIIILVLSPKHVSGPHLHFLTSVSIKLKDQENIDKILAAKSPHEVVSILLSNKGNIN